MDWHNVLQDLSIFISLLIGLNSLRLMLPKSLQGDVDLIKKDVEYLKVYHTETATKIDRIYEYLMRDK